MTADRAGGPGGRRGRGGWAWLLAVAGLVAIVVVGGRPTDDPPFDPRSTEPSGTRALMVLLDELGADVTITDELSAEGSTGGDLDNERIIAVLRDGASLSDTQLTEVDQALAQGATVVITDPFSPLTPPVADLMGEVGPFAAETTIDAGRCTIDALAGVDTIEAFGVFSYETAATTESCFGDAQAAFVTVSNESGGNFISFGGTTPFTNEYLGDADNAAAIASVLAPRPGTDVVVLEDAQAAGASASDTPFDLVDPSIVLALLQVGLGLVLYALWRGRRLGRPVSEPQPVDIAGSELVAAVGDLLHRTREPDRAARVLRDETRRSLCERLGLPVESSTESLAAAVEARTGVGADRIVSALSVRPVATDDDLVALARDLDSLRQEILHEHVI